MKKNRRSLCFGGFYFLSLNATVGGGNKLEGLEEPMSDGLFDVFSIRDR